MIISYFNAVRLVTIAETPGSSGSGPDEADERIYLSTSGDNITEERSVQNPATPFEERNKPSNEPNNSVASQPGKISSEVKQAT